MPSCKQHEPFFTPYVDGELDAERRAAVDAHVRVCPPCHSRVEAERAVRELLRTHQPALRQECAPDVLRARCAAAGAERPPAGGLASPRAGAGRAIGASRRFVARATPFAIAASLVVVVGGAFVYQLTDRSSRVMAAELTADHIKCFGVINRVLGTHDTPPAVVESSLASGFGWPVHLPERPDRLGLELVGARPCLYGQGRIAHIMYRRNGEPVSVFMLPRSERREEVVDVMGHEAAIWSAGDRTFVLIARAPRAEVEQLASFVHASLR